MSINWRNMKTEKPAPFQRCLTRMNNGIIEGTWLENEDCFDGYYFRYIQWEAQWWVPIEEVE